MKKIISLTLVMILMLSCMFVLTGCENKEGGENGNTNASEEKKNVDTYEVEAKFGGKLTFDMPKDSGYTFSEDTNKAILKHEENGSTIEIFLMNTSKSSIIMKEKDFSASAYSEYKETEIAGHEAYSIKNGDNFAMQYGILLDEYDKDHGKYHGLKIKVSKSSLKLDAFDPSAFVESETFKTLLNSLKFEYEAEATEGDAEKKAEMKNYGEFEKRTDGLSDKKGLIFIKKFDSPKADVYKAEQKNDNVGIDNYLWYTNEKRQYDASGIEVRIFPQDGTYENMDAYKTKKGSMYTWSKTTIAGKEYDTFVFSNSTPAAKYSQYHSGAFMVGNRVVTFHYNMYAEVPNQELGDQFFKQIMDSVEYSKDFK